MYRSQYDQDVSIFGPQGRIHQIEYAMEAVKQGSATAGIKSSKYAVLTALKRSSEDFSLNQAKLFEIDSHIGMSISGITSDARKLCEFMKTKCADSNFLFSTPMPAHRLMLALVNKMHKPTMLYGQRPYGVGLLIAAYDELGPHIYQVCPSANYYDCNAMAIGFRSQSTKTYLEAHVNDFEEASYDELIKHAIRALNESLPIDASLNSKNCGIAVVGENMKFTIFNENMVQTYLSQTDLTYRETRSSKGQPQQPDPTTQPPPS